jgi:tetratricopeptide (TPR) repeat protein
MLPPATVSGVLNAKTTPRLDFVLSYVRACLQYAESVGVDVPPEAQDLERWRERWQRLHATEQESPRIGDASDTQLEQAVQGVVPWQLPGASTILVGRNEQLAWLDARMAPEEPHLIHLHGDSGTGKTSLVLAWARRRRHLFAEGQLYADFARAPGHGATATLEILLDFLIALGHSPAALPTNLTGLAGMFRTALADRAMLVVLDNIVEDDDIEPFVPSEGSSRVIAISASRVASLVIRWGAAERAIGPLEEAAALELLQRVAPDLEPDDARAAAAACEYLPLRLRILGDHLVHAPTSRDLVASLASAPPGAPRLDRLLEWTVRAKSHDETRALYLMALHPGTSFDTAELAVVTGTTQGVAGQLESRLAGRHLLTAVGAHRHTVHQLVRAWAAEASATAVPSEEREAARRRLWGYYLWASDAADRVLLPQRGRPELTTGLPRPNVMPRMTSRVEALTWCEQNLTNMIAAVEAAVAYNHDIAHQLPYVLTGYFNLRKPWPQWIRMTSTGREVAARLEDLDASANLSISLGIAFRETRREEEAVAAFTRASATFADLGNVAGQAMALNNLATVHNHRQEPDAAIEALTKALQLLEGSGDEFRVAIVSHNLAEAEMLGGEHSQALVHAQLAYETAMTIDDRDGAAMSLVTLASAKDAVGLWEAAVTDYRLALQMQEAAGDRFAQIAAHDRLGELLNRRLGPGAGDEHLQMSTAIEAELS